MIYLDNCATTKPSPKVVEAMVEALTLDYGNPSSLHSFSHEINKKKESIRKEILRYFHGNNGQLIFTSGGTESNNLALKNLIDGNLRNGKKVISTNIEHPSILNYLKSRDDIELVLLSVNETGHIEEEDLFRALDEETIVVSLFHVNSELGSVNSVGEWVPKIREQYPKVKIHIDGVQAVGKIPVDVGKIRCHTYSFSGHKFHGPKGIGGLFVAKEIHLTPLLQGGGQEMGLRSGTENVPAIYGLGQAFGELREYKEDHYRKIEELGKKMMEKISESIEDIRINSQGISSPFIYNISFADARGEVILHMLEQEEIYISTSSACSSKKKGKNPILEAIGLNENLAEGTIRICFSHLTTEEEINTFVEALERVVGEIRSIIRRNA